MSKISPCLWFDGQAEEAAQLYTSLVPDSRIDSVNRAPADHPSGSAGDVLTVEFTLAGGSYIGLNGGPHFKFTEAVSFTIHCEDQPEVDYYWDALTAHGGAPSRCGWLKDRFGLSWQIVPRQLIALLKDPDPGRAQRTMEAMLQMKKIDIAAVERATDGG
jgi:predicted 3-demethylubiquinone-9 3-methyltransferase (glyoxalase superfamily)